jgi:hypothetical protein
MMHTPAKPMISPTTGLNEILDLEINKLITTSHKGKMAAMIAASPAERYFTLHVVKPLLNKKFKKPRTRMGIHSFRLGNGDPFNKKKKT